jgi:hypothetical protein
MQGMSSGPIEFSHVLVCSLFVLLRINIHLKFKIPLGVLFASGIVLSFSRSAVFIMFLLLLFEWIYQKKISRKKIIIGAVGALIISIGTLAIVPFLRTHIINRDGTIDHFSRPIEAIQKGFESPVIGQLGAAGPAARIQNLKANNNDQAFIAENVFADYFFQLGIFGLLFGLFFWVYGFYLADFLGKVWIGSAFLMAQMATIFDMIPLSLLFFFCFLVSTNRLFSFHD